MAAHQDTTSKACSKCGVVKPLDEFVRNRTKHDGREAKCRPCSKAHYAALRARQRAERRASQSPPPEPYSDDPLSCLFVVFRALPGEPWYGVDTDGHAWSCLHGKRRDPVTGELSITYGSWRRVGQFDNGRGYKFGHFGRSRNLFLHRLVLATFIPPPSSRLDACHNNGVRHDNRLANLRWDTRKGNKADEIAHGTRRRGSRIAGVKLTEADIPVIRRRAAAGERRADIAADFGVTVSAIDGVVRRRNWAYV